MFCLLTATELLKASLELLEILCVDCPCKHNQKTRPGTQTMSSSILRRIKIALPHQQELSMQCKTHSIVNRYEDNAGHLYRVARYRGLGHRRVLGDVEGVKRGFKDIPLSKSKERLLKRIFQIRHKRYVLS